MADTASIPRPETADLLHTRYADAPPAAPTPKPKRAPRKKAAREPMQEARPWKLGDRIRVNLVSGRFSGFVGRVTGYEFENLSSQFDTDDPRVKFVQVQFDDTAEQSHDKFWWLRTPIPIQPERLEAEPVARKKKAAPPPPRPLGIRSDGTWRVGKVGYCADHQIICDWKIVGHVTPTGYPIGEGWSPNSAADAEFIVRAANSHEVMLKAARSALALLEAHRSYLPPDRSDETWIEFNRVACLLGDAIQKAATPIGEKSTVERMGEAG